jgi:hypothetical protein
VARVVQAGPFRARLWSVPYRENTHMHN